MLELKQIQFFVACVEEGSFSRAAEVLYTSQPNISKVIRDLEQELGLQLFERGGRGITPTTEGKILYRYAKEMLQREQTITDLARSRRHNSLRLSINQSRSMARVITDYKDAIGEPIDLQVLEGNTETILKDVERYRSDLGFAFVMDVQMPAFHYNLQRRGMSFEVLRQVRCCVSMGERNLYSRNRIIRFREMESQKYVRYSDDFFSLENGLCSIAPRLKPVFDQAVTSNCGHMILNLLDETEYCNICVAPFYGVGNYGNIRLAVIEPEILVNFVTVYREQPAGSAAQFMDYLTSRKWDESDV